MTFTNSPLVDFTQISPNKTVPRINDITRITPHCYVGQASVEGMGAWFATQNAECSCNYGIGSDGRVGMFVQEKDRSWCSSSRDNDNKAVTIECASDSKHPYAINDKVYNKLIDLMTDICQRYNKTVLLWFGDKTRTLEYQPAPNEVVITVHRWFANKACPGEYIYSRLNNIADTVTRRLGGKVAPMYRVRIAWDKPETQIEADYDINNAIACADAHPGFSVYDEDGKCVYTSKSDGTPVGEYTPEQWIALLAPDAVEVCQKNGLLPSVMLAQACLETGWGKTDLAKKHNIFGMKCDLINNTWKDWTTWDGVSVHEKWSPEEENGKVVQRKSRFRVYDSFRQCMEDYAGFLLHVQNNKGYKYACIKGWTDPAKVIHRIRIGTGTDAHPEGYCTDSGYETKILNLINKYNLTQYDKEMPTPQPEPIPEPSPSKKQVYRVRVGIYKQMAYLNKLKNRIKETLDLDCFTEQHEDGTHIYCGSFSSKEAAKEREKLLNNAKFKTEIEVAEV